MNERRVDAEGARPGCKRTELGELPADWEIVPLSTVLDPARPVRYGIVQPGRYELGGCLMLRSQDYSKGWATSDEMHRVGPALERQYRNARIQASDLIMTIVGAGTGQVEVAPVWLDRAVLSRSTARIAVDETKARREFVAAILRSPLGKRQVTNSIKEGAQPVVSCRDVASFRIPYPPLPEQHAIAAALSDVDALIGALDRLIAKKRDLKQAAMQQLLTGQTRLPGFTENWETKRLGVCLLARPSYGVNAAAVAFTDKLPTYIRITDISEHGRFSPAPRACVEAPRASEFYLRPGDLVFARTGASVGKSYLYDECDGQLVYAGFLIRMQPDPAVLLPAFLAAYVTTHTYWMWVRQTSMRSGQPGINANEYANFPIVLPSVPEQAAISAVLSDMDAEIAALERRRGKTRLLKQGMMQELLTGRTRLV